MADPRDEERRRADLEWLYGGKNPGMDHTRRLNDAEEQELRRRTGSAADAAPTPQPEPAQQPAPTDATHPAPRPVAAAPKTPQPAAAAAAPAQGATATATGPPAQAAGQPRTQSSGSTPPPGGPGRPGGPTPPGGPATPKRRRRLRHPVRWTLVVLALLLAWFLMVPLMAFSGIKHVDAMPSGDRPAQQPGTAILLVGSDDRSTLTAAEKKQLGTGSVEGKRTDTMMILYVPPSGRSVLLSLPRDSYVSIPGHNKNKLNAAYSLGGPKLLMQTVEQNTGLRMDGYLEIGFGGFAHLIDALGGIRMCLPQPMVDKDSHTNLPAGCQTLNGTNALGYVRMRKADPTGDIGRTKRQREMVAAVVKKAKSPGTLLNPVKYWKFSFAGRDALAQDGVGISKLPTMAKGMMSIAGGDGLNLSVPTSSTNTMTAAGSSVIWDATRAPAMFKEIASGDTSGLGKYAK